MAKIDVYTAELSNLSAKLKSANQCLEEAKGLVSSAQAGLTMQVASREGIESQMSAAKNQITGQSSKVERMAALSTIAAQEFISADTGSGAKTNQIFSNVLAGLTAVARSVGQFLGSTSLLRHAGMAAIFLGSGTLLSNSILTRLKDILGNKGNTAAGAAGSVIGGAAAAGTGSSGQAGAAGTAAEKPHNSSTTAQKPQGSNATAQKPQSSNTAAQKPQSSNTAAQKPQNSNTAAKQTAVQKTTAAEKQKTLDEINKRYKNLPNSKSGKGFKSRCGALVYQQLKDMGIVKSGESTNYGKDYAKVLAKKGKTSKGYKCTGYQGNNALDQLLNANKNKYPITNIVCSFGKGGNFQSTAGHTMLISKIDAEGNVYFVDNTKASNYKAVCMSLKDFKKFYFKSSNVCTGVTHLTK